MASFPSSIDAALNKLAKNGGAMLHFASSQGCLVSCRFLVKEAGLDVKSESKTGVSPMFFTALQGNVQVTGYLLDHGSDPAMPDERGSMPLYNAAASCLLPEPCLISGMEGHSALCYQKTFHFLKGNHDAHKVLLVEPMSDLKRQRYSKYVKHSAGYIVH